MKQDIESQYDDDLTIGTDEYDDSYYTDADDLFDFSTNDESPISRLKSLVLSIDWEITDEVLLQFNEELIDLKGIWAGDSINLVYVQALEKLSKYIYQNKANSHPNAIKLLLTLYYNLEKIVSSQDLTEGQKKEILLEDVKRFESLKKQISKNQAPAQAPIAVQPQKSKTQKKAEPEDVLLHLKAIVLGIDWEITDQELNNLRREVSRLEELFAGSRPKLILLQGIGTLGAYIKTKKSNAHADAFKVLHLFYESLEKIVKSRMTLEEEKAILFPAVEKFNDFKTVLGPTISPEAISRAEEEEEDEEFEGGGSGVLAPALADVADEERGFQADEEARALGLENPEGVASHIDNFFGERIPVGTEGSAESDAADSGELPAKEMTPAAGLDDAPAAVASVDKDFALQGVDVGPDEEEEDAEDYEPAVAALADADDDEVSELQETVEEEPVEAAAGFADAPAKGKVSEVDIVAATDTFFTDMGVPAETAGGVDREIALQGVNVETEADEDSDEVSLPMEGEEVAPALVASEEESLFSAETLESSVAGGLGEEITGTLDDLFIEEQFPAFPAPETAVVDSPSEAISEELPEDEEPAALLEAEEPSLEESIESAVDELEASLAEPDYFDTAEAKGDDTAAQEEEAIDQFFAGSDLDGAEDNAEVDSLFESLEPISIEETEEEQGAAEISVQPEPVLAPEEQDTGWDSPAVALDEVEAAEEEAEEMAAEALADAEEVLAEALSVEDTEEVSLLEEEPQTGDEEISLAVEVPEDEVVSIAEAGPAAEEELIPPAVSAAEEEAPAFEDIEVLVEEEISFMEEISADEAGPEPEALESAPEAETEPAEEEPWPAEATPSLAEEVSPALEISEEISFAEDETLVAEDLALSEAPPVAAMIPPAENLEEEEEVVFELAEEEAKEEAKEEAEEPAPAAPFAPQPEELEEPAFAFAGDIAEELPPASQETVEEEAPFLAAAALAATGTSADDPLSGLRGCIESLGIELNDTIITGLFREINGLRQKWPDRPLEKTFLQLMSTIAQHIDSYRFEASSEAHNLLLSVYGALSAIREGDIHANQELLLTETLKVLEWQQGMLTRQAVQKGSQLTFVAPVRTEGDGQSPVDAQEDFDQLLQQYEEEGEVSLTADESQETATERQVNLGKESLAAELKQEIASLRLTLQKEIAELRNELTGR